MNQATTASKIAAGILLFVVGTGASRLALSLPLEFGILAQALILSAVIYLHRPGSWELPRTVQFTWPEWSASAACAWLSYVACVLGMFALGLAFVETAGAQPVHFPRLDFDLWLRRAIGFVLVAPILEEFAFRGWIQGSLHERVKPWVAVVGAAVLFGFAHQVWLPLGAVLMGCLFGVAVLATRSVWAGVLAHSIANARPVVTELVGYERIQPWISGDFALMAWALITALGIFGMIHFGRRAFRSSEQLVSAPDRAQAAAATD